MGNKISKLTSREIEDHPSYVKHKKDWDRPFPPGYNIVMKWLRSHAGKSWDKVWSKACARWAVGSYQRDWVRQAVATKPTICGKRVYCEKWNYELWNGDLYVDKSGKLKEYRRQDNRKP